MAATKDNEYYVILEDDFILKTSPAYAKQAVIASTQIGADLVLLNISNYPQSAQFGDMIMRGSHQFYRIFGGVGSGLSYIVKHEFGKSLFVFGTKEKTTIGILI